VAIAPKSVAAPKASPGLAAVALGRASADSPSMVRWLTPPSREGSSSAKAHLWAKNSFDAMLGRRVVERDGALAVHAGDASGGTDDGNPTPRRNSARLRPTDPNSPRANLAEPPMRARDAVDSSGKALRPASAVKPFKDGVHALAISIVTLGGAWLAVGSGLVLNIGYIQYDPVPAGTLVAAETLLMAFAIRNARGAERQPLRWFIGGYIATFSVYTIGLGVWELTDRLGAGLAVGLAYGVIAALVAGGWPWAGAGANDSGGPSRNNPLVAPIFLALLVPLLGVFSYFELYFFSPKLLAVMIKDWPMIAALAGTLIPGLWYLGAWIRRRHIGFVSFAKQEARLHRRLNPLGVVGAFLAAIAAIVVFGNGGTSAWVQPWFIAVAGYALFEIFAGPWWDTDSDQSVWALHGFIGAFYLMAYGIAGGETIYTLGIFPPLAALLGYGLEQGWRTIRRRRRMRS